MIKDGLSILSIFVTVGLAYPTAWAAETVNLPREELAQESVLPIFDKPESVKNRNITTSKHFDANLFYGLALTEPIGNVSKLGLAIYYNTSENHSFGFLFAKNSTGESAYASQLHGQFGLDFNRVPKQDSIMMLDWNIKAFYGKMSLSKHIVFNTSLYGSLAAGMVKYVHKSFPAVAIGFGQKYYFTNHISLRADLRLYAHTAPTPFLDGALKDGSKPGQTADPIPTPDKFKERMTYSTNLDVGLSYLF